MKTSITPKRIFITVIATLALVSLVALAGCSNGVAQAKSVPATSITVTAEGFDAEAGTPAVVLVDGMDEAVEDTYVLVTPGEDATVDLAAGDYSVSVVVPALCADKSYGADAPVDITVAEAITPDADGAKAEFALTEATPDAATLNGYVNTLNTLVESGAISAEDAQASLDAMNARLDAIAAAEAEAAAKATAEAEAQAASTSTSAGTTSGGSGNGSGYATHSGGSNSGGGVDNVNYGNADRTYGTTYSPDYSREDVSTSVGEYAAAKDNAFADSLRNMTVEE